MKGLLVIGALCALVAAVRAYTLNILHTNDMHARFQETSKTGGPCVKPPCFGGFARIKRMADSLRDENTLFLDAGDYFQGSSYFTIFKWKIVAKFIDMMGIDVMTLGNHEFDLGPEDLSEFINNVKTPIVNCNLNASLEPSWDSVTNLKPWVNLTVGGVPIAVIGYVTPFTKYTSKTGKVIFNDEVTSARNAAKEARAAGAKIVIALSHSGFPKDRMMASLVEELDLIIGGHTHNLLYTGEPPNIEVPVAKYPHIETQTSGKRVAVVQAYAFTKYLGQLKLEFNEKFELVSYSGNPILMDQSIEKDINIEKELAVWKKGLEEKVKDKVGVSKAFLDGETCRKEECNLGNLVADAFVDIVAGEISALGWTKAPIGIINGGGIRSSIEVNNTSGTVIMDNIYSILPFENPLVVLAMNGSVLMEVLEHSVSMYDTSFVDMPGGFLQYSGLKVVYDLNAPPRRRVVSADVRCGKCMVPKYEALDTSQEYRVVTNIFLAGGGDHYDMLAANARTIQLVELTDTDATAEYFKLKSPVYPGIEGRIIFHDLEESYGDVLFSSSGSHKTNNLAITSIVALVLLKIQ